MSNFPLGRLTRVELRDIWISEVLRDDQWERIKPFVPGGRKGKRGPRSDGRLFIDALLWMARSGGRWRDLPERFGPFETAKKRYYRWIGMGVLDQVFDDFMAKAPDMGLA
jgi:transposase